MEKDARAAEYIMEPRIRLKGMLWGLVVGDCLGSPVQFTEKDGHAYITDMVPCAHFNTPAGYWTDDASMAFCIMESFIQCGKYDLADIGKNFLAWYQHGFWSSLPYAFDVGGATASAMHGIAHGSLVNGKESSQGNGSIMRFAPSYIMNLGNSDDAMLFEISDLTHASRAVRIVVKKMRCICDTHLCGRRTEILSPYRTREEVNNSGWAVSTLDAALWAFHTTDSFEDGLIAAVNLGGDADTIGAVYGQIAGAYYGFDAIPARWLAAVKDREKIDDLIERFLDQHEKTPKKKTPPDCGQKCPLSPPEKINYFARKWYWKFLDRYPDLDGDGTFADECFSLGFGMDSGKWFVSTFPDDNVQDPAGLRKIIGSVNDVFFLGTAIFSYWRYQTHWADWSGMAIYEDEARDWMLTALERLIELTTEYKILLSRNDGSENCVLEAGPHRVILDRGKKKYGPVAKEYFVNDADKFGCHYLTEHIPTDYDPVIIRRILAKTPLPLQGRHRILVEEEFWGQGGFGSDPENHAGYVERSDGSVISGRLLRDCIRVAGVFAIPDRKEVLKELKAGQRVILVRERDNEHDENAIRVETYFPSHKIGYIPRKTAACLAVELDRGFTFVGEIVEIDAASRKIVIRISRREIQPLDGVRSITLREFGGSPEKPDWEYRTEIDLRQRKFRRNILRPDGKTAFFELKFFDEAWTGFVVPCLRVCNFFAWEEDQYNEKPDDTFRWELQIRRGSGKSIVKFSGGKPLPVDWHRFQYCIRECLDQNTIKGDGRFKVSSVKKNG